MFRFFDNVGFVADPRLLHTEVPAALTLDAYLRQAGQDPSEQVRHDERI